MTYDDSLGHELRTEMCERDQEAFDEAAFMSTFENDGAVDYVDLEVDMAFEAMQTPVSDESSVKMLEFYLCRGGAS